ncbi:BCL2/adenovirus E1B 19 kDa protein-interacting protein 3 isoform X1 [Callorhinchus milii]|uniref:BCL2/adenovirus E1B 19 kDa protein-interacting protein 3 n=1 Tax=Callorhinchus milii TaxID=7868 RepID=V9LB89_CALMI|nr:BCL2/adenovirus E1B 19 kDa protein-interacting protein 3 isoform X1 [Callorhinchus milii]|eukprot:gi/632987197/ref/XP_007910659.1/ PREDICTED: BCL2/adenovirus E1B 19 kDa protein-interacting protein 3-like [Callorhinchus milii]
MSVGRAGEDSLNSSWVELHYIQCGLEHVPSSSSIHNGDMERILLDAQHEVERSGSQCNSPLLQMSPSLHPLPAEPEIQSIGDRNSTQVCTPGTGNEEEMEGEGKWKRKPQSDEETQEKNGETETLQNNAECMWYWSSRPENFPPKEFVFKHPKPPSSLGVNKTSVMKMKKNKIFSSPFVMFFIPSLLVTHLLTLGVGIYIGKRLAASSASAL